MRYTALNMVHALANLPRDRHYNYIHAGTPGTIEILDVKQPLGPVMIRRNSPKKATSSESSISSAMMERYAAAISEGLPINVDRILGASYNTRSALEALLAHTAEFYFCYPGRISPSASSVKVHEGHKHLVWQPKTPHQVGVLQEISTNIVISESAPTEIVYGEVGCLRVKPSEAEFEHVRRHAQIQYLLAKIGHHFGYKIWIAQNDRGVRIGEKTFAELPGVLPSLKEGSVMAAFTEAGNAAKLIDCIWFRNGRLMPAVFEVEHSTGVTSGLTRMKNFHDILPPFKTRYVIAAPDEDRTKVLSEFTKEQFKALSPQYLSYTAIEELAALCSKRNIQGITDEFIDSFCERVN